MSAVCKLHPQCKLMLNVKDALTIEVVQADVLQWLGAGTTCDADKHWQLGRAVKKDIYKMRIR
jgi:hypothetical protein